MLDDTDGETTDDVDGRDDYARDRLAPDEAAGAVHAREEVSLPLKIKPHPASLLAGERARVDFRVDRHLPAWQAVEREPGRHLARPRRAGRDHHELHDRDDRKDHATDHEVVGGHKLAEGFHDLAGSSGPVDRRPRENQPRGRDVENESDERDPEQERGKDAHIERRPRRQGAEQGDHRDGEIHRQEHVDHGRRHGREHHQHGQENGRGDRVVHDVCGNGAAEGRGRSKRLCHASEYRERMQRVGPAGFLARPEAGR